MLFALIGTPCSATLAASRKEFNSWRLALAQWFALTGLAWILTTVVYQSVHFLMT
jgi:Fe2+ transport system protein B